jgi:predicted hydrocarbon binding protein
MSSNATRLTAANSKGTAMAAPEVPIDVDPATGIWTTDSMAMIYMPRHFFVNYYMAMDAALGRQKHQDMLYQASHKSAWEWSAAEAKMHALRDIAVFRHYLARLSQRGWGRFDITAVDLAKGTADVRVDHSAFALQLGRTGRCECSMFAGSLAGGMAWATADAGRPIEVIARERQCLSEGHAHCRFEVRPGG